MSFKVFLSAGHGGTDAGAVNKELKEKDINLSTMLKCKSELERHGIKVVCSRTKDENDPVTEEVKEANSSGADIAFSIHANAGGGDGFEAFYYSTSAKGKGLATICEKYVKALGQNSRGVKVGDKLYFIKHTKMTAVLVESAFIDNAKDRTAVDTKTECEQFGVAYAKAILEYLGIKWVADNKSVDNAKNADNKSVDNKSVKYKVQVGAYKDKANAEKLVKDLKAKGYDAIIVEV